MKVEIATRADIPGWLKLASQVEFLFGPMVDQPDFHRALRKNIDRESAYCVREQDGSAGAPLMGGLFLSFREHHINWLLFYAPFFPPNCVTNDRKVICS